MYQNVEKKEGKNPSANICYHEGKPQCIGGEYKFPRGNGKLHQDDSRSKDMRSTFKGHLSDVTCRDARNSYRIYEIYYNYNKKRENILHKKKNKFFKGLTFVF